MRQADIDGNGKISFMEFVSVMNQRLFRMCVLVDGMFFQALGGKLTRRWLRRGELTEADLKSAFDVRGLSLSTPVKCVGRALRDSLTILNPVLQIYDTNHDGFISSSELEYMLHLLGKRKFSRHEVTSMIEAADNNEDGKIDYTEFCQLMQKNFSGAGGGGKQS